MKKKIENNITLTVLIFYSLPMVAGGLMNMLVSFYLMKFSTDALLIAPAAMGLLFLISRIWDAVNDPIVGYLSDHTNSRFGRRKIWILSSAVPVGVFFYLLWMPPAYLKTFWMGFALIGFYTVFTTLYVPHYSLGAELTSDHHTRHRVYGARAIAENLGIFLAVGVLQLLPDTSYARMRTPWIMFIVAVISIAFIVSMHFFVKEDSSHKPKPESFIHSATSVFKNPHARLILIAGFFGQLGAAVIFGMTLYFAEYVLLSPSSGNVVVGIFILCASASVPVWIYLLKHFEKKTIWISSNLILAMCFAMTFTLTKENISTLYLISIFAGTASGSILFIHPSALADTIDYEELMSSKKSQGIYFAIFTFVNKSAMAIGAMAIGLMLSFGDFKPNLPQTDQSLFFIRITYALFPPVSFIIAAVLLTFYSLSREEHTRIRNEISKR
ncbi:MAG: MFS transporter [Spirochaetia bacterium]|nr:MFS transporter [Spirochaetia bacterium]